MPIYISAFVGLPRPDIDPLRREFLKDNPENAGIARR